MPPPKIIAGRYEVLRELGRGGMGVVYLVQHVHTHEQLALKLLSTHVDTKADAVERFRREMRAPALIKSDHVVKIMDADVAAELDGAPFYVMEYLVGCDVGHMLQLRGKLSAEETVWILNQVARGLDKAHQIGIVHRDLTDAYFTVEKSDPAGQPGKGLGSALNDRCRWRARSLSAVVYHRGKKEYEPCRTI